ncbi:MAG: hypothetical protein Q9218_004575 [Villophora microphyllina]
MHQYTGKDIRTCLDGQRILYIGDSTTRQLFWATAKKLNATAADEEMHQAGRHEDLTFEEDGVIIDFIWDPFLNSSSLRRELISHLDPRTYENEEDDEPPGLITVGGGLWYARHFEFDWLDRFRNSIDDVTPLLSVKNKTNSAVHDSLASTILSDGSHAYLTPVQIPLYDVLSPSRASTMRPDKINPMNEYLYNISRNNGVKVVWSQLLMTRNHEFAYEESGLHVVESVASRRVDVILNMRCNAEVTLKQGYPFDKTCCSTYRNATDRTHVFNKAHKHFTHLEFFCLCTITSMLGVLSIHHSTATASSAIQSTDKPQIAANEPFLSRDQTDEWKGWMQFVILIYHYTGASRILWIYKIIRVLVASYLFMTGFGHTLFFYRKQDYSLKRSASVLLRLNLLSCLLPYLMDTDYLFYYFAPLVSFWYIVVYLTMRIGHSRNASIPFLLGKIGLSAVMVTNLVESPKLLEKIFALLQHTCRINWNLKEWRFRLQLDLYIVYVGMLVAILYSRISDTLQTQRFPQHDRTNLFQHHWGKVRIISVVAALVTLAAFWIFSSRFQDKVDYNWWNPYISPLPIVSFIILRNCNRHFRNRFSSSFAWLGRCSLETFTLQFHIWLAADTKGLLSLGIFGRKVTHTEGRYCDLLVLTVAFLFWSWFTADATATITNWIIDPKRFRHHDIIDSPPLPKAKKSDPSLILAQDAVHDRPKHLGALSKMVEVLYTLWATRLEVRLFSIVLSMWAMNMMYT